MLWALCSVLNPHVMWVGCSAFKTTRREITCQTPVLVGGGSRRGAEVAHLGCGGEWPPDDVSAVAGVLEEEQTRLDPYGGLSWAVSLWGEWRLCVALPSFPMARGPRGRPSGGYKPCVDSARPTGGWSKGSLALTKEGTEKQNVAHVVPKPRSPAVHAVPRESAVPPLLWVMRGRVGRGWARGPWVCGQRPGRES